MTILGEERLEAINNLNALLNTKLKPTPEELNKYADELYELTKPSAAISPQLQNPIMAAEQRAFGKLTKLIEPMHHLPKDLVVPYKELTTAWNRLQLLRLKQYFTAADVAAIQVDIDRVENEQVGKNVGALNMPISNVGSADVTQPGHAIFMTLLSQCHALSHKLLVQCDSHVSGSLVEVLNRLTDIWTRLDDLQQSDAYISVKEVAELQEQLDVVEAVWTKNGVFIDPACPGVVSPGQAELALLLNDCHEKVYAILAFKIDGGVGDEGGDESLVSRIKSLAANAANWTTEEYQEMQKLAWSALNELRIKAGQSKDAVVKTTNETMNRVAETANQAKQRAVETANQSANYIADTANQAKDDVIATGTSIAETGKTKLADFGDSMAAPPPPPTKEPTKTLQEVKEDLNDIRIQLEILNSRPEVLYNEIAPLQEELDTIEATWRSVGVLPDTDYPEQTASGQEEVGTLIRDCRQIVYTILGDKVVRQHGTPEAQQGGLVETMKNLSTNVAHWTVEEYQLMQKLAWESLNQLREKSIAVGNAGMDIGVGVANTGKNTAIAVGSAVAGAAETGKNTAISMGSAVAETGKNTAIAVGSAVGSIPATVANFGKTQVMAIGSALSSGYKSLENFVSHQFVTDDTVSDLVDPRLEYLYQELISTRTALKRARNQAIIAQQEAPSPESQQSFSDMISALRHRLEKLDSERLAHDGRFEGEDGSFSPNGQAVLSGLLEECFGILYEIDILMS